MKAFFKSKKIKVLLGTVLLDMVIFLAGPEWQETAITLFTTLGGVYIGGQSFADAISKGQTSSNKEK